MTRVVALLLLSGCFDYRALSAGLVDSAPVVDAGSDAAQDDATMVDDLASTDAAEPLVVDLAQPPSDLSNTDLAPTCECVPGTQNTIACGNCGQQVNTCGSDCKWQQGTTCSNQGTCTPGTQVYTSDGCEVRTCSTSCQWSVWGLKPGAMCASTFSQSCFNGGVQGTQTCTASCTWGQCQ